MSDRHSLIAFLSVIIAIVVMSLVAVAVVLLVKEPDASMAAALATLGGAITGLIGLGGTFKPRSTAPDQAQAVTVTNPPSDPIPVEPQP
ncbi:hypothetical protein ABC347_07690 [Sphingomonas sp. 1P06PA]|uniref:hypothetical protein n=1 Tax=Sphingomonas sp. 1P06PA TaxID=554121 RepID=UPI0039A75D5C